MMGLQADTPRSCQGNLPLSRAASASSLGRSEIDGDCFYWLLERRFRPYASKTQQCLIDAGWGIGGEFIRCCVIQFMESQQGQRLCEFGYLEV
jgi:hypothetical protein